MAIEIQLTVMVRERMENHMWAGSGNDTYNFCSHCTTQSSVIGPYLMSRKTKKCSLVAYSGGRQKLVSLPVSYTEINKL